MKSQPECLVCMMNQAWNTAKIATAEDDARKEIMNRTARLIQQTDLELTPADNSKPVYDIVAQVTGDEDPYHDLKRQSNQEALSLLPQLRQTVGQSEDRMATALHIAVAGNIIDLGIGHAYDLSSDIDTILQTDFAIDNTEAFKRDLVAGRRLLMLGDNSGEIVFDRLLIEEFLGVNISVTYCVKSKPIINDVTMEDARAAGIYGLVPVIETGSGHIGINFDHASAEFLQAFYAADTILAKGQGNFETCNNRDENIYFLLKAKCNVVAGELGVEMGAIVFKNICKN
ncbi:DUF89 domain-containing protein [Candidatus Neomarinimicrobiota bacterium]